MPAEPLPENDGASSPLHSKLRRFDVVASGDHQTPPPSKDVEGAAVADDQDWDASDDTTHAGDPQHQAFVHVDLLTIRKEVQCPICLGIIKKTRTVMECMHRFCRECIDKSMRMGNNECPACRTHCASRRSLRDDPRYDALIAALYPDIRKFEEEELAFHEEDDNRNKQIQDSIAEVLRKQSEVLGKKRSANKFGVGTSMTRPQRSCRNVNARRRGRRRNASPEFQDSDENSDSNGIDKHYDPDEHHTEMKKQRRGKSKASIGSSHSPSSTNLSGGSSDNNLDQRKEEKGFSPGLTYSTEMLAWGRGGVRSNTRSNSNNGGMSMGARRIRLTKPVDNSRSLKENDEEYVALQTSLKGENVEMFDARNPYGSSDHHSTPEPSSSCNDNKSEVIGRLQDRLHILSRDETLSGAVASYIPNGEQLVK